MASLPNVPDTIGFTIAVAVRQPQTFVGKGPKNLREPDERDYVT